MCSSDLADILEEDFFIGKFNDTLNNTPLTNNDCINQARDNEIGRASCRERV